MKITKILFTVLIFVSLAVSAYATDISVRPTGDYSTIQAAIDAAQDGGESGGSGPAVGSLKLFSKAFPFTNEAVDIVFSELVKDEDALNAANYSITGGLRVNSVTKNGSRIYQLHTSIMTPSRDYTITATNIHALDGTLISSTDNKATFRGISSNPGGGLALSDTELLDNTEALSCRYAYEQALTNGLIKDTSSTSSDASVGATGFGLANLCTLYERYASNDNWIIPGATKVDIKSRVEKILDTLILIQSYQSSLPQYYGRDGLFYHFIGSDNRRSMSCELSTIDSAILFAGVITAGQYFGGEIQEKAEQIINAVDWSPFFDTSRMQFYHGWRPETGFIAQTWDYTTDETILVCLIALASNTDNENFKKAFYRFRREPKSYQEYNLVPSWDGSLFQYLFAHMWFDFKKLGKDSPSTVGESATQVDWWQNTKQAVLANRQFCVDESSKWELFGPNAWGLTACWAADYSMYLGRNGGLPSGDDDGPFYDDGRPIGNGKLNLTPSAALMSLPILKDEELVGLSDNIAFNVLKYFYYKYYTNLWKVYGPVDSFDSAGYFCPIYTGINIGAETCMLENYLSGMLWDNFMSYEDVQQASSTIFPNSGRPTINEPSTWDVLSGSYEGGKFVVNAGALLQFKIKATDDDGTLYYYGNNLPEGAVVDKASGIFSWTPTKEQADEYNMEIRVTDGNARWETKDIIILVAGGGSPEITTSGTLTKNETWFGVVNVTGDVIVPRGITLTISPNTKVYFRARSDDTHSGLNSARCELIIKGSLNAQGTSAQQITFSSNASAKSKGDWQGIVADRAEKLNMQYCLVEYAQDGINLTINEKAVVDGISDNTIVNNNYGIYCRTTGGIRDFSTLTLSGNTIANNCLDGIYLQTALKTKCKLNVSDSTNFRSYIYNNNNGIACDAKYLGNIKVSITNSDIYNNKTDGIRLKRRGMFSDITLSASYNNIYNNKDLGIRCSVSEPAELYYNNLYDNANYDIRSYTAVYINAQYNWWGQATTAEMKAGLRNISKIYDHQDSLIRGDVFYEHWLSSPVSTGYKVNSSKSEKDVQKSGKSIKTIQRLIK